MGLSLKCPLFLTYTLLLFLSTKCALKITASEIGSDHHIRCIPMERQALLKLKSSVQTLYNGSLESWGREGHEDDCCKWSGVECSSTTGHVTRLDLSHIYAACMIDASLVKLRYLSYLNLSHNRHNHCQIPQFIGRLSKLEELDLSSSGFGGRIPHQLGNLSMLMSLDLSENDFNESSIPESFKFLGNLIHLSISHSHIGGKIQDQLRNLSKLRSLDLSYNGKALVHRLEWVSHLYSLQNIQLDGLDLSKAFDWGQSLMNLPQLTELHMSYSSLPVLDAAPPTITPENASSSLSVVDLSWNKITASTFGWLLKFNSSLSEIYLQKSFLGGPIPNEFRNMPHLSCLDLSENELDGDLSKSIAYLHKLSFLDLSSNSFHGIISEDHLSNFTNMEHLFLSSNSLTLSLSPHWIPPFQLYSIGLSSCNLGPQFPSWLQTQTSFYLLDISSNRISVTVPVWFWTLSLKVSYMDISNNKIHGEVPSEPFSQNPADYIDLSFNNFEGQLPLFNPSTGYINLSNNNFTGTLSSLCNFSEVIALDLSNNYLSGELPLCWKEKVYSKLALLGLSNNNLAGNIHNSLCSSANSWLVILQLGHNSFTGELPSSLSNCTNLRVLDVRSNMISGSIPEWIGNNMWDLRVLILRSNRFVGSIPSNLCRLQQLHVMDLSSNNLTGCVVNCLHNSSVLTGRPLTGYIILSSFFILTEIYPANVANFEGLASRQYYNLEFSERIMWKGKEYEYKRNLKDMRMVDFSSNKLQGEIPEEFGSLVALRQLNLSNNNLTGSITSRIGEMSVLEVLDLSSNHLWGEIPQSISNLNFLATLDLSNNSLTGQIPKGTQIQTQTAASFMDNPGLCGDPLPKKCHQQEAEAPPPIYLGGYKDGDEDGFYISMGVGFLVGFWGVLGSLLFHNSWCSAYFRFLSNAGDWLYVRSAFIIARIRRR